MNDRIGTALRQKIRGRVITDESSLKRYSRDQSIYEVFPSAIVIPADIEDILITVRFCVEEAIPITARGGGSGTAGAALGKGVILSFPRGGMNRILRFNDDRTVAAEAGVLHDDLQKFLRCRELYLPADPSSGAISFLGGNIATKASGPHALKHGSIDRYIKNLQFVTACGEVIDTSREETIPARIRDSLTAQRKDMLSDQVTVTRLDSRKKRKIASGYNMFTFLNHSNTGDMLSQLMVGSVGTLGIITCATFRAEQFIPQKATMLLYFQSLHEACKAVLEIKEIGVAAIEIMNYLTIKIIKERYPDLFLFDKEAHMLLVEFEGQERFSDISLVEKVLKAGKYALLEAPIIADGKEEQESVWKVRKSVFPTLKNYRPNLAPLSLVNDIGVEERYLADFILDVEKIFEKHKLVAAIYGHAGSGNLHLRPLFDTADTNLTSRLVRIADEVYEAVLKYDGTITAEHGMGRLRTPYLTKEWGETIVGYMKRVKQCFDPQDILNPDVMFSTRALTDDLIRFSG